MDTTLTTDPKSWVDFAFYVFDAVKAYLLPVLGGMIAGSFLPQPHKMLGKGKGK